MGIVRKKRIFISKKNYTLQDGGSNNGYKIATLSPTVPKFTKWKKFKYYVGKVGSAAKMVTKAPLVLPVAATAAITKGAITIPTQALYQGVKASAKSIAPKILAGYQSQKLNSAQKELNKKTGAHVFRKYQENQAKKIKEYQKQHTQLLNTGKSIEAQKLTTKFIKNSNNTITTLHKKLTTPTTSWYKPSFMVKQPVYKQGKKFNITALKSLASNPLSITDFSTIINAKKDEYNSNQTRKVSNKINTYTKKQTQKKNDYKPIHNQILQARNTAKEISNKYETKKTELNKLKETPTASMDNTERSNHYTALKIAQKNYNKTKHKEAKKTLIKAQQNLNKSAKKQLKYKKNFNLATEKAGKETLKKEYYTSKQLQESIERRRDRLNKTKKKLSNIWNTAGQKIKRSASKSGDLFMRGLNYTFDRTKSQEARKVRENAYIEAKAAKQEANNAAKTKADAQPSLFSKIKRKFTPMWTQGASTLQEPIKHIKFLKDLQTEIDDLGYDKAKADRTDLLIKQINLEPITSTYTADKKKTQLEGAYLEKAEYATKFANYVELKTQFNIRKKRLLDITGELKRRTNDYTIEKTMRTIRKKPVIELKKKFAILVDNDKLKPFADIGIDDITVLLNTFKQNKDITNFNLINELYKHKKNNHAIAQFKKDIDIDLT